uniref:Uncharacterized protein n=1 Tax=Ditylenchus dipsaci TaxID=166011 RepID=A0A915E0T8_9BILA
MESSNSESDQENEGQLMMPLYIREVVIEGVDKSQKRGARTASTRSKKCDSGPKDIVIGRSHRAKGCNGRGFTMRGMFHVTAEHNHDNKRNGGLGFEVQKRLHKGDRLATQLSRTPTETLVKKVRHGASRQVRAQLPSKDSVAHRIRVKKLKEVLRSIDNEEMTMPDSARQTLDEMRFLFWDSREQEPDNTTILIWMSENQEKLLEETEFLSFDAT